MLRAARFFLVGKEGPWDSSASRVPRKLEAEKERVYIFKDRVKSEARRLSGEMCKKDEKRT